MIDSIINCPSKSQSQSERNEKVRYYLDIISEVRNLLNMESCQSLSVGWKPSQRALQKMSERLGGRRGITQATVLLKTARMYCSIELKVHWSIELKMYWSMEKTL